MADCTETAPGLSDTPLLHVEIGPSRRSRGHATRRTCTPRKPCGMYSARTNVAAATRPRRRARADTRSHCGNEKTCRESSQQRCVSTHWRRHVQRDWRGPRESHRKVLMTRGGSCACVSAKTMPKPARCARHASSPAGTGASSAKGEDIRGHACAATATLGAPAVSRSDAAAGALRRCAGRQHRNRQARFPPRAGRESAHSLRGVHLVRKEGRDVSS